MRYSIKNSNLKFNHMFNSARPLQSFSSMNYLKHSQEELACFGVSVFCSQKLRLVIETYIVAVAAVRTLRV